MINRMKAGLLTLSLIAGAAAPAWASPIAISNVGMNDYESISLTGGALGNTTMNYAYAGQLDLDTSAGTLGVWCVDLFHEIDLGGQYTATYAPLATNNANSPAALTSNQISEIEAIAAFGNALLEPSTQVSFGQGTLNAFSSDLANFQSADSADYSTINYSTNSSAVLDTFAAAVQASIWDVEYGTTASNTSDANFSTDVSLVTADAGQYFGNVGGSQLNITDAQGDQIQAQFISQVPEPGSLALLGAGLLGLGLIRRRKTA